MKKSEIQKVADKLENAWYSNGKCDDESDIFYWFAKRLIRAKRKNEV